jgi:hypothetical protein
MTIPKKGEYWKVQYGAEVKTNIIVKLLSDNPEFGVINWTKDNFSCSHNGVEIKVKGELFVELFAEADEPLKAFF